MSGGVDSAVAAARAVEAGHDVTGIHLALSRNPASYRSGARGCCTIEDSNDARRAADVIGIPFYVWDLSERFHADVVEDFMDEYAAGRTPNPCLRCNEKIKFAAVLDRALALGFDAVATGHYAQLRTGADGLIEMHRAVDGGKDQSYVLGVLDQQQLAHSYFPLGDTPKSQVREEAARRGLLADLWGPGLSVGRDTEVVGALTPRDTDIQVTKWRYSAFQRTDLRELLAHHGRDQLLVTGVYAHMGCLLSAAEAFMNDIQPFFVADATADFSRAEHEMALSYAAKRCAVVTTTDAVSGVLSRAIAA